MILREKHCIVTGAARGIGLALARELLAKGARVVLTDVDEAALDEVRLSLPLQGWLAVKADVTRAADLQAVVEQGVAAFGPLDVWVNNAGLARHRWIQDYTEGEIELMLNVNLKGTILGSQAALRAMMPQRGGHIVNVVSTASLRGIPSETVYCAAKWGVRGFTQGLGEEAAAYGIKVTAVLPGGVATEFWTGASDRAAPLAIFLTAEQRGIVAALEMDGSCVLRELVLRSIQDGDFSVKPAES
jgi:NAD(P)-dependent dehydrogenase (short-subunit alcohol dehydrogenase family)